MSDFVEVCTADETVPLQLMSSTCAYDLQHLERFKTMGAKVVMFPNKLKQVFEMVWSLPLIQSLFPFGIYL